MKTKERLNIKETLIGIGICLIAFVKNWIWLITGQGFVKPLWQSVVAAGIIAASLLIGEGLMMNLLVLRERSKIKIKIKK